MPDDYQDHADWAIETTTRRRWMIYMVSTIWFLATIELIGIAAHAYGKI